MNWRKMVTKKMGRLALLSMVCATISSCQNDVYNPDSQRTDKEAANTFNFATTEELQLNVQYEIPTAGYQVLFEVYFENPIEMVQDADDPNAPAQWAKRDDIKPAITRMTDENGRYSGLETVAANHEGTAYIYTEYTAVPKLLKVNIEGNTITADVTYDNVAAQNEQTNTRAYHRYKTPEDYKKIGIATLGTWNDKGKPEYLDEETKLEVPVSILDLINDRFPEKGKNDNFQMSTDFLVKDEEGRKAEVAVRFIDCGSGASSGFGYYCYPENATIEEIRNAKKCIIFPNTNTGYANIGINSGLKSGESVKLHYFDETGKDCGTEFPSGTKIGWFNFNDSFKGTDDENYNFYSTSELNGDEKVNGKWVKNRTHTAAMRACATDFDDLNEDFIVFFFEDYTDNDYNDVQFCIWSNPIEAIVAPGVPDVKPEQPEQSNPSKEIAYTANYNGILAFEDNWPGKGDYDMNDVIVRYNCTLSYNKKNEVVKTEDTFTAMWSGASYNNSFSYELNTNRNNVTTTIESDGEAFDKQGLDPDLKNKATINVFFNAKDATAKNTKVTTYNVTNVFDRPVKHEKFGTAPYNPFISVDKHFKHDQLEAKRIEVHLVKHDPTNKADMSLFNSGHDQSDSTNNKYYIASGNYPFAINLANATEFATVESKAVDAPENYPDFTKWVESNGATNKDWYIK